MNIYSHEKFNKATLSLLIILTFCSNAYAGPFSGSSANVGDDWTNSTKTITTTGNVNAHDVTSTGKITTTEGVVYNQGDANAVNTTIENKLKVQVIADTDYTSLALAISNAGSDPTKILVCQENTIADGTTVTPPDNVTLDFDCGGSIKGIAGGGTETFVVGHVVNSLNKSIFGTNLAIDFATFRPAEISAKWFGNTYAQATITAALTAIETIDLIKLRIDPSTWVISSNADWSAYKNVTFKIVPGAVLQIASGTTTTFSGTDPDAGDYQIFSFVGTGAVRGIKNSKLAWFDNGTHSNDAKVLTEALNNGNLSSGKSIALSLLNTTNIEAVVNLDTVWDFQNITITQAAVSNISINVTVTSASLAIKNYTFDGDNKVSRGLSIVGATAKNLVLEALDIKDIHEVSSGSPSGLYIDGAFETTTILRSKIVDVTRDAATKYTSGIRYANATGNILIDGAFIDGVYGAPTMGASAINADGISIADAQWGLSTVPADMDAKVTIQNSIIKNCDGRLIKLQAIGDILNCQGVQEDAVNSPTNGWQGFCVLSGRGSIVGNTLNRIDVAGNGTSSMIAVGSSTSRLDNSLITISDNSLHSAVATAVDIMIQGGGDNYTVDIHDNIYFGPVGTARHVEWDSLGETINDSRVEIKNEKVFLAQAGVFLRLTGTTWDSAAALETTLVLRDNECVNPAVTAWSLARHVTATESAGAYWGYLDISGNKGFGAYNSLLYGVNLSLLTNVLSGSAFYFSGSGINDITDPPTSGFQNYVFIQKPSRNQIILNQATAAIATTVYSVDKGVSWYTITGVVIGP